MWGSVTYFITNRGENPPEPVPRTNPDPRGTGQEGFLTGENLVPKLGSIREGTGAVRGKRHRETHWDGPTQEVELLLRFS